jgi:hypothetical protein
MPWRFLGPDPSGSLSLTAGVVRTLPRYRSRSFILASTMRASLSLSAIARGC